MLTRMPSMLTRMPSMPAWGSMAAPRTRQSEMGITKNRTTIELTAPAVLPCLKVPL